MSYCAKHYSPIFALYLDVEGALGAISHSIVFHEYIDILADAYWHLLNFCYKNVIITFPFNIFYQYFQIRLEAFVLTQHNII